MFDTEVGGKKPDIECVYEKSSVKNRETCDICQSQITISEDGFNTCSNKKCGIIYKDNVDQTAEWNFMVPMIITVKIQRVVECL